MNWKDTLRAGVVWLLTLEARAVIRMYTPRIILITGSVGKTSAKDAVYSALAKKFFVRKSEKSFNSDIGAPLTVLGVPNGWSNPLRWLRNIVDGFSLLVLRVPYPEWLIVEVGADRPGDITRSLAWLKPQVVVATRFPAVSVHVEFYDSPEAVQQEELAPLYWLRPGGVLVGNADDPVVKNATLPDGVEKFLYGIETDAQVVARKVHVLVARGMPRGISFDVHHSGSKAHVVLEDVVGMAHVYAALAGITTALSIGIPLEAAVAGFAEHDAPRGRMHIVPGAKGTILIDDTYNASPAACEEALLTVSAIPRTGRRIAVMGDMLELGAYSVIEHEKVGAQAAQSVDMLVTVGVRARGIAAGAEKAGLPLAQIFQFDRGTDAGDHLSAVLSEGDVILIKGSQGMRMERITKSLMANPDNAKKLLCRQDAEWMVR